VALPRQAAVLQAGAVASPLQRVEQMLRVSALQPAVEEAAESEPADAAAEQSIAEQEQEAC
jgi:hypothetical protein